MRASKRRNGKVWISAAAVLAVAAGLGALWHYRGRTPEARADSQDEERGPEVLAVKVVKPKAEGIERTTVQPGTFQAFEFEYLFPKVSGYLTKQKVDINSVVKKGEILAEIEAPELLADQQHAAAALVQARSQVTQMEAHVSAAQAALDASKIFIDQKKAEVKRATSSLNYREKQYKRYYQLVKGGSLDRRLLDEQFDQLESAQAWKDAAEAGVRTAVADVEAKKAKVKQAEADLSAAKANVDVARASLQRATVFVEYTKIRSNYDGVVTARNYHNGTFIRAGDRWEGRPLLVVQRQDLMRLIIQVPDSDVPLCDPGDPVDFTISTLPLVPFRGYKVARISKSQDERSRTMRAEVDVPNPKGLLRDGMFAEVTIHLQKGAKEALRIPSMAVRRANGKTVAYVVRNDVVHEVEVQLGQDNGMEAEVLRGLRANELVVRNAGLGLHDGMAVRATLVSPPEQTASAPSRARSAAE
jgi:RND family efflux transporter MFP subunit